MVRRINRYIHWAKDWPDFRWDHEALVPRLLEVRHRQGRLIGRMEELGFHLPAEAVLQTLTEEVLKSSEIEGEGLDREEVRSSIARRLGMDIGGLTPADRTVEGRGRDDSGRDAVSTIVTQLHRIGVKGETAGNNERNTGSSLAQISTNFFRLWV